MRTLAAVTSLLAFGHSIGYLPLKVAAIKLPARKDTLHRAQPAHTRQPFMLWHG